LSQVIVRTERLAVRLWRDDEAERVFDLYARDEVVRWLGPTPRPMTSPQEAALAIARWRERHEADPRYGVYAVVPRDTGVPAGSVLLVVLPDATGTPTGDVEIGWHLHPDAWGHGYATEAARALVAHAFAGGAPRVHAVVRPGNERSIAVCRRLGMEHHGRTSRYYGVEVEHFTIDPPEPGPATAAPDGLTG
jgi:RimJ/RimL family protein N-acetyltransferase